MKDVKIPTSDSWHDSLVESFKDYEHEAAYLQVALEMDEGYPEPELLRAMLKDVIDARVQMNNLSEAAKQCYEKLDKLLAESGGAEIYALVELLDALGFRMAVVRKDQ